MWWDNVGPHHTPMEVIFLESGVTAFSKNHAWNRVFFYVEEVEGHYIFFFLGENGALHFTKLNFFMQTERG